MKPSFSFTAFRPLLLAALTVLAACSGQKRPEADKPAVTVSILPLKYFVEQIAGDDFDVEVLVPPGAGPETYEPRPAQIRKALQSKLYFNIGLIDSEKAVSDAIRKNAPEVEVVDLYRDADLIEADEGEHGEAAHGHRHGGTDPHIWTSPKEVRKMAETIYRRLAEAAPDSARKYARNYERFLARIDSTDRYVRKTLADLETPYFIILHPALGYYARDYGLVQLPVEEDGKETSAEVLKRLLDTIRGHRIRTVFYQREFGGGSVASLAREGGLDVVEIDPLAYDWTENLFNITNALKNASPAGAERGKE